MVYFKSLGDAVTYAKKYYLETGYTVWFDHEKKMYYVISKQNKEQKGDNYETEKRICTGHRSSDVSNALPLDKCRRSSGYAIYNKYMLAVWKINKSKEEK